MSNILKDKNILVTGGNGSIGSVIVREILRYQPKAVRALSNDENGLFNLEQELRNFENVRFLVGDIRDKERLHRAVENIDLIFHAAALKHVPLCERNPFEAVKTNVLGSQNLVEVAIEEEVDKMIILSTDKAVTPFSVMGATKLLAERLVIAANYYKGARKTAFSCVRFGNVLNSQGSVFPIFVEQIKKGGPITLTDPNMTRFVMSISKAVGLVLKAAEMAKGGEIFILKMSALRIGDLADAMIEELALKYGYKPENIEVKITGKRPGERYYEVLMAEEEIKSAYELGGMFMLGPDELEASAGTSISTAEKRYKSNNDASLLTRDEIKLLIRETIIEGTSE
ncbi:UDP-N-acetylglucosamine 4,6-dehydratase family protein [Chloroflexota bacterium]